MNKFLIFSAALCLYFLGSWGVSPATTCAVPNTFTNGTPADANQVNANFSALQACGNNIDFRNIGAAGIYASQMVPGSIAQATFAGLFGYTFNPGAAGQVPLTIIGATSQTADLFDVWSVGLGSKYLSIGSGGIVTFLLAPVMSGASITAGTIPDSALATAPVTSVTASGALASSGGTTPAISCAACVTSVTASGNLASSGGTTPAISMTATPTFTSVASTNGMVASSSTYGPTSATVNGGLDLLGQSQISIGTSPVSPILMTDASPNNLYLQAPGSAGSIVFRNSPITTNNVTFADNGNITLNRGSLSVAQNITATDTATTTQGPVAPCYTSAGAACAGTHHVIVDTITCVMASSNTCSNSATFFVAFTEAGCSIQGQSTGGMAGALTENANWDDNGVSVSITSTITQTGTKTATFEYACEGI